MSYVFRRMMAWEHRITPGLMVPMSSRWRTFAAIGAHLGDGLLWAAAGVFLLIAGTASVRGLTLVAGLAVFATAGVSAAVKYVVRRRRPQELDQFYASTYDLYSFPSGHAARMAAIAVSISHFVPGLAVTSYSLAAMVAVCRVLIGVHYPSDVLAGWLIGFVAATCIVRVI